MSCNGGGTDREATGPRGRATAVRPHCECAGGWKVARINQRHRLPRIRPRERARESLACCLPAATRVAVLDWWQSETDRLTERFHFSDPQTGSQLGIRSVRRKHIEVMDGDRNSLNHFYCMVLNVRCGLRVWIISSWTDNIYILNFCKYYFFRVGRVEEESLNLYSIF